MDLKEQGTVIKFLVKLNKDSEIVQQLNEALGEFAMKPATVYKWKKRFKEGRESVDDNPKEGRPVSTGGEKNVRRVDEFIVKDRRVSTRFIAEQLGINRETVRKIINEDLKMRKLCARVVPKVLSLDQKLTRVRLCEDWLQTDETDDLLSRVITGDESWFYEYDPLNRRASMVWTKKRRPQNQKSAHVEI